MGKDVFVNSVAAFSIRNFEIYILGVSLKCNLKILLKFVLDIVHIFANFTTVKSSFKFLVI